MTLVADIAVARNDGFDLEVGFEVEEGHTLALLGPNGAGKSTVAGALAGLIPIDRGQIVLGGRVLDDPERGVFVPPEERRVGVVFQDYVLFPHMSVKDNIGFGPASLGQGRQDVAVSTAEWMGRLGLDHLASRKGRRLSGGEAQKVALARALIIEPDLLILDEPLAALDTTTRTSLRHQLDDHLSAFAGPRLLITHDATEAFLLADRICVIEEGSVTQTGSADDIRLRPRTRYAADLAGANLLSGSASHGVVDVDGAMLQIADTAVSGDVLLTIQPRAVTIHLDRPEGSARNAWETRVARLEDFGDRVRVQTADPMPLIVEITPAAVAALALRPGAAIWVSVKATEIGVEPD